MFGVYRTLLALMVVAQHLGGTPKIGAYAVFGFYILSGYLMTLIMHTRYEYTISGVSKYLLNRSLRIYPIYWVAIIFSAALVWYLGDSFTLKYDQSIYLPKGLTEFARNLFLFFPFRENPRLSPPTWALTVEIFFYILIGIGISRNKVTTIIWFIASGIYHYLATFLNFNWEARYYTVFAASLPFSTGALIFHYKHKLNQYFNMMKGKFSDYVPYILFPAILANWYLGRLTSQLDGAYFYYNYILCAIMVASLSEKNSLPFINKDLDNWVGDFSYPIYLIHFQIGLVVILVFSALGVNIKRPDFVLVFVSIPLMLLYALVFNVLIEKPIELLRRKVKG
jgi:peptidoglycan/LPS O-acetylase OafA/YrhL